ncbi:hypothetical protein E2C01_071862 [Portunus trituberculatus]|uniref:Uncharacterized protein n=1 Tax=Portunus trituberculatus TaxID=210409 RepID=A0A5B7I687_PORTR|nr:hypothetical protein [Portunus trituberculatus]
MSGHTPSHHIPGTRNPRVHGQSTTASTNTAHSVLPADAPNQRNRNTGHPHSALGRSIWRPSSYRDTRTSSSPTASTTTITATHENQDKEQIETMSIIV